MHNIWKRLTAGCLAALMVLSFSACNRGGGNGGGSDTIEIKPLEGEEPVDLGGETFKVVDFSGSRWNRENNGTPYYDAWQKVLDEVETLYNCKIELEVVAPGELFEKIQPEVMAGGKYADIICTTQWAFGKLIGAGLMADLNDLKNVNWDNKWWNQNIRQMSTVQGRTYAANGSFIFDAAQTWLMYYNETIWNELQLPDPYEMVNSGKWTVDKMREYCKKAMRDNDQSGAVDSKDDRWGVLAADGDFCRALFMALGGHYFDTDADGRVQLACNNEKSYSIVEKMANMVQKDGSVCKLKFENEAEKITSFSQGNSLFYCYMPGIDGLKDMEDNWGVMPLPKLDESQEQYLSGVDHNATVCGVTNTNDANYEKVGTLLEALGRHAVVLEDIYWPDYEETYWRHAEDGEIVANHVAKHGQYDMALIMQNCNAAFSSPMGLVFSSVYGSNTDFSSSIQAAADAIKTNINEYFDYEDTGDTTEPENTDAAE